MPVAPGPDWAAVLGNRGLQRALAESPRARTLDHAVGAALQARSLSVARDPATEDEYNERLGDWKAGKDFRKDVSYARFPGLVTDQGTKPDLAAASSFKLSLRVKVKDPDYLLKSISYFVRKYSWNTFRNYLPSVLGTVERFTEAAPSGMGHAWVKMFSYDEEGKLLQSFSIGFYPGTIENPDSADTFDLSDKTSKHAAQDYTLNPKEAESALDEAFRWKVGVQPPWPSFADPIRYDLWGSNCVSFVEAIAKAAGLPFNADKMPAYSSTQGFGMVANPNMLLSQLQARHGYDPTEHAEGKEAPTPTAERKRVEEIRGEVEALLNAY